ncbi:hypothetical protein [Thalassospira xiamenensis]|uniref:Uncharacterized protein n=1 Tax=Thalassospira xiamenensis TaxID=220697 RepID=A0A285TY98_9PROT|nr:hypothetical protein [Thalassospira xiamenensis]SOC30562.1 hypothetical protein SAMN05428964_109110 [Thalassospira xiamenensis]
MTDTDWEAFWSGTIKPVDAPARTGDGTITEAQLDALLSISCEDWTSDYMRKRLRRDGLIDYSSEWGMTLTDSGSRKLISAFNELYPHITKPLPFSSGVHVAIIDAKAGFVELSELPVALVGIGKVRYGEGFRQNMTLSARPVVSVTYYYRLGSDTSSLWMTSLSDEAGYELQEMAFRGQPRAARVPFSVEKHMAAQCEGREIKGFLSRDDALDYLSKARNKLTDAFEKISELQPTSGMKP